MTNLEDEIEFQYTRGKGPGGQNKNKVASCVVATHGPTGIRVRIDGRDQHHNKREAIDEIRRRVREYHDAKLAAKRKARRDEAIKNCPRVRTYDFISKKVTDHRTGKTASLKDVLEKGRLDLLR